MGVINVNVMSWSELKKLMIEEYCLHEEMQKMEQELWNLEIKGANVNAYTSHFNDRDTLNLRMVTPECKKVERYIWGLPHPIQGLVTTFKLTTYGEPRNTLQHHGPKGRYSKGEE